MPEISQAIFDNCFKQARPQEAIDELFNQFIRSNRLRDIVAFFDSLGVDQLYGYLQKAFEYYILGYCTVRRYHYDPRSSHPSYSEISIFSLIFQYYSREALARLAQQKPEFIGYCLLRLESEAFILFLTVFSNQQLLDVGILVEGDLKNKVKQWILSNFHSAISYVKEYNFFSVLLREILLSAQTLEWVFKNDYLKEIHEFIREYFPDDKELSEAFSLPKLPAVIGSVPIRVPTKNWDSFVCEVRQLFNVDTEEKLQELAEILLAYVLSLNPAVLTTWNITNFADKKSETILIFERASPSQLLELIYKYIAAFNDDKHRGVISQMFGFLLTDLPVKLKEAICSRSPLVEIIFLAPIMWLFHDQNLYLLLQQLPLDSPVTLRLAAELGEPSSQINKNCDLAYNKENIKVLQLIFSRIRTDSKLVIKFINDTLARLCRDAERYSQYYYQSDYYQSGFKREMEFVLRLALFSHGDHAALINSLVPYFIQNGCNHGEVPYSIQHINQFSLLCQNIAATRAKKLPDLFVVDPLTRSERIVTSQQFVDHAQRFANSFVENIWVTEICASAVYKACKRLKPVLNQISQIIERNKRIAEILQASPDLERALSLDGGDYDKQRAYTAAVAVFAELAIKGAPRQADGCLALEQVVLDCQQAAFEVMPLNEYLDTQLKLLRACTYFSFTKSEILDWPEMPKDESSHSLVFLQSLVGKILFALRRAPHALNHFYNSCLQLPDFPNPLVKRKLLFDLSIPVLLDPEAYQVYLPQQLALFYVNHLRFQNYENSEDTAQPLPEQILEVCAAKLCGIVIVSNLRRDENSNSIPVPDKLGELRTEQGAHIVNLWVKGIEEVVTCLRNNKINPAAKTFAELRVACEKEGTSFGFDNATRCAFNGNVTKLKELLPKVAGSSEMGLMQLAITGGRADCVMAILQHFSGGDATSIARKANTTFDTFTQATYLHYACYLLYYFDFLKNEPRKNAMVEVVVRLVQAGASFENKCLAIISPKDLLPRSLQELVDKAIQVAPQFVPLAHARGPGSNY